MMNSYIENVKFEPDNISFDNLINYVLHQTKMKNAI